MPDDRVPMHGIPIAQALAAMPMESPDASAWPALARRLAPARRERSRWPLAMAAAAVVGIAIFALPREAGPPGQAQQVADTGAVPTQTVGQLAALMAESARLERLVTVASDDGASSASAAALSLALVDSLKGVDGELATTTDPATQLSLWQERVDLLRDVARLETSRHYLAAQGQGFDVALVSAY